MADIKQAAKWMQEGKLVRRPSWPPLHCIGEDNSDRGTARGMIAYWHNVSDAKDAKKAKIIIFSDLLADDWELAED